MERQKQAISYSGLPGKRARRHAELTAEDIAACAPRFWAKVDKSGGPDACWPWTAALAVNGYGQFFPSGSVHIPAHRFSMMLAMGRTPAFREVVMHRCHVRKCVNPAHLVLGSHGLNNMHTAADGQGFIGAANGMAKLTAANVSEVRALVAAAVGRHERAAVIKRESARLGVHHGHLLSCVTGRFWSHLPGAVTVRRAAPSRHAEVRSLVADFFAERARLALLRGRA